MSAVHKLEITQSLAICECAGNVSHYLCAVLALLYIYPTNETYTLMLRRTLTLYRNVGSAAVCIENIYIKNNNNKNVDVGKASVLYSLDTKLG